MKKALTKKQTKMLDILKDTKDYYSKDPNSLRAKSGFWDCYYINDDGDKCAVGRYLNEKDLNYIKSKHKLDNSVDTLIDDGFFKHSKIITKLPLQFWKDVQNFHDMDYYWNKSKNTISQKGLDWTLKIKKNIIDGVYK